MKLYELSAEFQSILDLITDSANEETGECDEELMERLNNITVAFQEKAVNTAIVYRELISEADKFREEEKRLAEERKRIEKSAERLKSYLQTECVRTGVEKISSIPAKISFRSSEKTVIDNLDAVPEEYIKVEYKPDLTAIKNALKSGVEIDGAHIEKTQNIQIK